MKLKDYPFNLYAWGFMGLSIRINNDTKQLNNSCSINECLKELNNHPQVKQIANSEIISTRTFFDELVIVIDYEDKK